MHLSLFLKSFEQYSLEPLKTTGFFYVDLEFLIGDRGIEAFIGVHNTGIGEYCDFSP